MGSRDRRFHPPLPDRRARRDPCRHARAHRRRRPRLVAARGDLPDLPALVRRLQRRRHRRPARHHRAPALPARPRRRRGLALALLHLAAGRRRLRRRRLPRRRPALRHARRRRRDDRPRPRPRPAVIVDLVPNHSSDEHEWFQAALAAGPGSPERARYLFRDGQGEHGELPPNNWESVFGGPAWTRTTDADGTPGQWYLHLFDTTQPDFDWDPPRGARRVRGHPALLAGPRRRRLPRRRRPRPGQGGRACRTGPRRRRCWATPTRAGAPRPSPRTASGPRCGTRTACTRSTEQWRTILTSYNPVGEQHDPQADRILCAEAWVTPQERAVRYVRADEMHQAFNFDYLQAAWLAPQIREVVESSLRGQRLGRRAHHVGAVQPRRRPPRLPARAARRHPPPQRHRHRRPAAGRRRSACGAPAPRPR